VQKFYLGKGHCPSSEQSTKGAKTMQAVELWTHVLSTDEPWQIKSVDVNEGGLRMDIHVGFNSASRLCLSRTYTKTYPNCSMKLT
jgi:hypothetical protein